MPKSYQEGCLAAHALDLIGDRWALLVVRELMLGPKRFGAIRAGVPGIATNMLAQRLVEMEAAGLLTHEMLPQPAAVAAYRLTEAGAGLWPVIAALCQWGARQPGHDPQRFISPTALMLSMRAMANPAGSTVRAGFVMGDEAFAVALGQGRYEVARSENPGGGPVFHGDANALAVLVYGRAPVREAVERGLGRVVGDMAAAQAFVDRFSLTGAP